MCKTSTDHTATPWDKQWSWLPHVTGEGTEAQRPEWGLTFQLCMLDPHSESPRWKLLSFGCFVIMTGPLFSLTQEFPHASRRDSGKHKLWQEATQAVLKCQWEVRHRAVVKPYWNAATPGKQVTRQLGNYNFFSKMRDQYKEDKPIYKPLLIIQLPQAELTAETAFLIIHHFSLCIKIISSLVAEKQNTLFQWNLPFWCFTTHTFFVT